MDKHLDKIVVVAILVIGLLVIEYKSRNPVEPSTPTTPFMKCMSLIENRAKMECMEREKLDGSDFGERDNMLGRK